MKLWGEETVLQAARVKITYLETQTTKYTKTFQQKYGVLYFMTQKVKDCQ